MSAPAPRRVGPDDAALPGVLALIRGAFAYTEGRVDPPSETQGLTLNDVVFRATREELWVIEDGARVVGCAVLAPKAGRVHIELLATAASHRGRGLARQLVDLASVRARKLGLAAVELQSRVELTEVHSVFAAMGFRVTGAIAHPGFELPTSVTYMKAL